LKSPSDCTILVADDEEDLREAISFDFKRKGYRVVTAPDGREALQAIKSSNVDLVISDIHMPNLDGIGLLSEIKKHSIDLPVFLFIGCSSEKELSAEEAYALGADAVFSKPFDRKELFDTVAQALLPLEERLLRKAPHLSLQLPVGLNFLKSKFLQQTTTINLGRGGMFVALQGQFPEALEEVEFMLKAHPPLNFDLMGSGSVRWVRRKTTEDLPAGCGIAFEKLDPASIREVMDLTNCLKHKSFIPRK